MIYSKQDVCPICQQGKVGFRKCANSTSIVLMCDECDSIWLEPNLVEVDNVIYLEPPDFVIPSLNCSLLNSRWASREEVNRKGWGKYYGGEGKALDES